MTQRKTFNNGNNVWLTIEGIWIKFGTGTPHEKDIFVYGDTKQHRAMVDHEAREARLDRPSTPRSSMSGQKWSYSPEAAKDAPWYRFPGYHKVTVPKGSDETRDKLRGALKKCKFDYPFRLSKLEALVVFALGCLCGYIANSAIWIYFL